MADGLCGPSNPLQNLQKHSTVDRTLQQDRLTARQSPSQAFRTPGPNAGILDPEFEAFQAGKLPLPHPEPLPTYNTFSRPNVQAGPSHQAASSSWAVDFQRLNIASPSPSLYAASRAQSASPNLASWHQDFIQRHGTPQGQGYAPHPSTYNAPLERLSSLAAMPLNMHQPMYQAQPFGNPQDSTYGTQEQSQSQIYNPTDAEIFDEAAFERAFAEAARSTEEIAVKEEVSETILVEESAERLMTAEPEAPTARIGADLIHDPRQQREEMRPQEDQMDADALARTAGELLDSVSNNTSEKFQNSTFLQLMRQIRDKEVLVSGDKIVDAHSVGNSGDGGVDGDHAQGDEAGGGGAAQESVAP